MVEVGVRDQYSLEPGLFGYRKCGGAAACIHQEALIKEEGGEVATRFPSAITAQHSKLDSGFLR